MTCFANAQTIYNENNESLTVQNIENLTAFAEIYNCVRYFYPSKAVQTIDWKKFAIYGVRETQNCTSKQDLMDKLNKVFLPLCGELQLDSSYINLQNLPALAKKGRQKYVHYGSGKTPYLGSIDVVGLLYKMTKPYYTKIKSLAATDSLFWYGDKACILFFAMPVDAVKGTYSDYKALKHDIDTITINQLNVKKRDFFVNAKLRSHRLASIIIAWGNFRHFYPYKDLVSIDWERQIKQALQEAVAGDHVDFYFCLRKMLTPLNDGHIYVLMGGKKGIYGFSLDGRSPDVSFKNINDTIVLKEALLSYPKGSIIDSVNGIPIEKWYDRKKEYVSASPQLKRIQAAEELLMTYRYDTDTSFQLALTLPTGEKKRIELPVRPDDDKIDTSDFVSKQDNIYIFSFRSAGADAKILHKTLRAISRDRMAKGVIIDFRDARYMDHKFLGYFIDSTIYSTSLKVPIVVCPKQEDVEYKISRFKVTPREEKITLPVVFLIDGSVMSYGESVMGMVEHYKLGAIVGEPTAGINGDVATLSLPVHDIWRYTGMRVDKHDGSPLFCVGITPTHAANHTVAAYQQGIDVPLQKAMKIIKQSNQIKQEGL
jgi:hypothetical protein